MTPPGAAETRALAARHGIRPSRALGQHFLVDPNLARAIAADAGVGTGDRVIEIGAGFGSLTVALAERGADVLAIELDRALIPALEEVVGASARVRVLRADATTLEWDRVLDGAAAWVLCANLPYNVATPLVLHILDHVPAITRLVVMVQHELGERLLAAPGEAGYGPAALHVAYRTAGSLVRRVPPTVFWPRPNVESVVLRLERRGRPAVEVGEASLWRVVEAGFAERRKTMRSALRRAGIEPEAVGAVLASAGIDPSARAEDLSLEDFARLANAAAV